MIIFLLFTTASMIIDTIILRVLQPYDSPHNRRVVFLSKTAVVSDLGRVKSGQDGRRVSSKHVYYVGSYVPTNKSDDKKLITITHFTIITSAYNYTFVVHRNRSLFVLSMPFNNMALKHFPFVQT